MVNPMLSKQNFMLLICKLAAGIAWLESQRCGFSVGSVRTSNNAELVYVLLDGTATQSYCGTVVEHWSFLSMATRIFVFWVMQ